MCRLKLAICGGRAWSGSERREESRGSTGEKLHKSRSYGAAGLKRDREIPGAQDRLHGFFVFLLIPRALPGQSTEALRLASEPPVTHADAGPHCQTLAVPPKV